MDFCYFCTKKHYRSTNYTRDTNYTTHVSQHNYRICLLCISLYTCFNTFINFKFIYVILYAFFQVILRRLNSDAGELPRRKHTTFRTRRKFEIKNMIICLLLLGEWRKLHNEEHASLLTPWSRVLLEKLTGSAASQEIPRIFGTRRFLTVLTSARHLSLS